MESEEDDDSVLIADLLRVGRHIDGYKHIEEMSRIGRLADNKVRSSIVRIKSIEGKQGIFRRARDLKDSNFRVGQAKPSQLGLGFMLDVAMYFIRCSYSQFLPIMFILQLYNKKNLIITATWLHPAHPVLCDAL